MSNIEYKVAGKIIKGGYPTSDKAYHRAHEDANYHEKKANPREYNEMKRIDKSLPENELAGTHTRSGEILVSSRVPERDREGVATHEFFERKDDPGYCHRCGMKKEYHK